MKRLLPFLALLFSLLLPLPVAAQDNPVTWTVTPGFNGTFKSGAWIPITVTIANTGDDLRGRLEWRWRNGGSRYAQSIDLPRGAKKQVVLPALAESFGGEASLAVYNGDALVAIEDRIRFNQVDMMSLVVGVISDTDNALAEVGGLPARGRPSTALVRLTTAELPDRWELLQSLDVLFVHDVDTGQWSEAQRAAVELWVAGGGQLVVGGDRAATAAGFAAVLPARVAPTGAPAPLGALAEKTGWRPRDPAATVPALQLTPTPDAEVVSATAEGLPLLARRAHGRGLVLQAAFDLGALNAQGNPVPLWDRLLLRSEMAPEWNQFQSNAQWVLEQSLSLPALRLPSLWSILGFLALYIALVGPANYFLLRRLDRREWAYLTIPLTVALFTAAAYGVGAAGRGSATATTALSAVRVASGSTIGQGLTYLGVYSPGRDTFDVGFGPDALVADSIQRFDQSSDALTVVRTESGVEVPSFFIDVGAMRSLNAQRRMEAPEVRTSLRRGENGQWTVEIVNSSATRLEDAALLVGQNAQSLDDLAPGESQTVVLDRTRFIDDVDLATDGVIKRREALRTIQNQFWSGPMIAPEPAPGGAVQAMPREPVTLAAWSGQPSVDLTLDGTPADVQGDTVYLWTVGMVGQ